MRAGTTRGVTLVLLAGALACGDRRSEDASAAPEPERAEQGEPSAMPPPVPDPQPEIEPPSGRPVFRLGDNRLLAHQLRGAGLHVPASSAALAKYLRFAMPAPRWRLGVERDGVRAAALEPLASLEVPLTRAMARAGRAVRVRVHARAPGRLTLKLGGRRAAAEGAQQALVAGWQTVVFPVDPDRLVAGENQIVFEASRGVAPALASLEISADAAAGVDLVPPVAYDAAADAFTVERDAGLAYYVAIPQQEPGVAGAPSGEGAAAVHLGADVSPADCTVEVMARAHDAHAGGLLRGTGARVDLSSLAGMVARLELRVAGCARARIASAVLEVAPVAARSRGTGPPPRFIVLWIMDALRADRVAPFSSGARAEVPNLTALAARGTVFRQYWVQGNESQTSTASLWTSLYPAVHQVRPAGRGGTWRLGRELPTLGSVLDDAGWTLLGVTGNGYITEKTGHGRHFDVFRNLMREGRARRNHISGHTIVGLGTELLEASAEGPTLLYLGTIDTHTPWVGHQPWLDRYDPEPYEGRFAEAAWPEDLGLGRGSECTRMPEPRDLRRIRAIYDSAISYQDELLGRFVERLREHGMLEQTMLIVTADHGEELWEHGRCGHGASLRQSLVRVPLLIHYPPLLPAGVVVDEGAEGVDVLPTILEVLGLPAPERAQGASLLPLAHGAGAGYPRPSYASHYESAHAMQLGRWKARVGSTGIPDLFDVEADPQEMRNLALERPIERRFVTDALSTFLVFRARWNKARWGVASNMRADAAPALDALEAVP